MSKELEEIIDLVERAKEYCEERCLDDAIDKLRTLAKPVQYVVQIQKYKSENGVDSIAYLNGHIFYSGTEHEIRQYSHELLSARRAMFALPPITIEQITFVEV